MYLAFYKGKSIVSRIIKFRNWSEYSHVSYVTSDGIEYEAWKGGFRKCSFGEKHKHNTKVDLYRIDDLTPEKEELLVSVFEKMVGTPYDWAGCFRFITRSNKGDNKKLFCSEAVMVAFKQIGYILLKNIETWKVYPALISYSPKLTYFKTVFTIKK